MAAERPQRIELLEAILIDAEFRQQVKRWAPLAVASDLVKTEREYIEKLVDYVLPRRIGLIAQPDAAYRDGFNISLFVDPRIPLDKLLKLVGIRSFCDVVMIKDWEGGRIARPEIPYFTWAREEDLTNRSAEMIRGDLVGAKDKQLGIVIDGIARILRNSEILGDHFLVLPGSQVGPMGVPELALMDFKQSRILTVKKPILDLRRADSILPQQKYAALICTSPVPLTD